MNRYSFRQYRSIDLTMFAVILCVSEALIVTAANRWFPDQLYTVSAVGAVTAIVLMRWGPWALLHAVLGGIVFCIASHGSPRQFFIYCTGNILSLLMLIPLRSFGKDIFGLGTVLLMQLGRALLALLLGGEFFTCLGFFTTDVLSLLFTGVIVWIARRLDGIFEDQKHYLLRIHEAEEKEGGY